MAKLFIILVLILAFSFAATFAEAEASTHKATKKSPVKKTIPAVGGYSNTLSSKSESATVGIVSSLIGEAYLKDADDSVKKVNKIKVGDGVRKDTVMLVETNAKLGFLDTNHNEFVFIGPSVVLFKKDKMVQVISGLVGVKSAQGQKFSFINHNILVEGEGSLMLNTNDQKTQVVSLEGSTALSHPKLKDKIVQLPPGYLSESSSGESQIEPVLANPASLKSLKMFLRKFDGFLSEPQTGKPESHRHPASNGNDHSMQRGSRKRDDVIEKYDAIIMKKMKSRQEGVQEGVDEELADSDDQGSVNSKANRKIASTPKLKIEVVRTKKNPDRDENDLIERLRLRAIEDKKRRDSL